MVEIRNERVTFRVSATERQKLEALAEATRRSPSQVVRLLIEAAATDGRPDVWLEPGQRAREAA